MYLVSVVHCHANAAPVLELKHGVCLRLPSGWCEGELQFARPGQHQVSSLVLVAVGVAPYDDGLGPTWERNRRCCDVIGPNRSCDNHMTTLPQATRLVWSKQVM